MPKKIIDAEATKRLIQRARKAEVLFRQNKCEQLKDQVRCLNRLHAIEKAERRMKKVQLNLPKRSEENPGEPAVEWNDQVEFKVKGMAYGL